MNLVSDQLRDSLQAAMKDVFDTFSRNKKVRFYKTATETIVQDWNYSGHWDLNNNHNIKEAEFAEFNCIVIYEERQPYEVLIPGSDTNMRYDGSYNRIRVQMELAAYEWLKDTERFVFDDILYQRNGVPRGLGLLKDFQYYEIVLQRVN